MFYFIIFLIISFNTLRYQSSQNFVKNQPIKSKGIVFFGLLLILMIGFKYEVGADWYSYQFHLETVKWTSFNSIFDKTEPAYWMLVWFGANVWGNIYFVNTILGFIFCWGLIKFSLSQSHPWLVLISAFPYLVVVVALGYSRQSAAIGLVLLGIIQVLKGNTGNYILLIIIAVMFHNTAIIMLPFAILTSKKHQWLYFIFSVIITYIVYNVFFASRVEYYNSSYLERGYKSSGTLIRLVLCLIPSLFFISSKKYLSLTKSENKFWSAISYFVIVLLFLFMVSPSSTAVDRLSLYFIPIQLFVLSNIRRFPFKISVGAVIIYSGIVLVVWLTLAIHAKYWLPYQFYPLTDKFLIL